MSLDLSVIICTLNRAESLKHALQSLLAQTFPADSYEIIVVDNGSTDHTRSVVEALRSSSRVRFLYIYEPEKGLSVARNRGILEAKGEVVAFMDDDAQAGSTWLASIMEAFNTIKKADGVGGPIEPLAPTELPSWLPKRLIPMLGMVHYGSKEMPLKYPRYPYGSNMAFRRGVFERAGLFDPSLGRKGASYLAGEETDLFLRIERLGGILYYCPSAVVYHPIHTGRLRPDWFYHQAYWQGASKAVIERKSMHPLRVKWNTIVAMVVAAAATLVSAVAAVLRRRDLQVLAQCTRQSRVGYIREVFKKAISGSLRRGGPRDHYVKVLRMLYRLFPFPLEGDGRLGPYDPAVMLSVVFPTHTRPPDQVPFAPLETCLLALAGQKVPHDSFEVIVVEDGPSSPQTLETLKAFEADLMVRHIRADDAHKPLGYLRNLGLEHARGEWILMMDDDSLLAPDFLENFFLLKYQTDPYRDFIIPHGIARYGLLHLSYDFLESYSLGSGCIIYPRPLLKRIRGFHSQLPCFEDIDLAIRAYLAGGNSLQAGQLQFFHPPLYLALGNPTARERGRRVSEAYRLLRQVYSIPVWLALVMKEVLKLPHLLLPSSVGNRAFATLALYTLRGLLTSPKKSQ